jgi:hypothetical protein
MWRNDVLHRFLKRAGEIPSFPLKKKKEAEWYNSFPLLSVTAVSDSPNTITQEIL